MNLDQLTVTTTNGTPFTGKQSADLAWLVYLRFGCDEFDALQAWRRLLQNNCGLNQFVALVDEGRKRR
jgi:hypothetical protein